MELLDLPPELQLAIADYLFFPHLSQLRASHRHFRAVLGALWLKFASQPKGIPPRPALIWAAQRRDKPLVSLLLSISASKRYGVDVHVRYYLETALHIAASNGSEAIMRLLLESGADIEALDPVYTPLIRACMIIPADMGVVRALLERGAVTKFQEDSALHHAARNGTAEVVRILVEEGGVDINAFNNSRQTPLLTAISDCRDDTAIVLLDMGANPSLRGRVCSPLTKANERGAESVIRVLLEKLLLLSASGSGGNKLAQNWHSHDHCSRDGKLALDWAAYIGDLAMVEYMLSVGVPVNGINEHRETALHRASQRGHGDIIRALLDAQAVIDARDYSGWTPLHLAARSASADAVEILLSRGADPNARNDCRITALH